MFELFISKILRLYPPTRWMQLTKRGVEGKKSPDRTYKNRIVIFWLTPEERFASTVFFAINFRINLLPQHADDI